MNGNIQKNIVCLGGGTGTFVALKGLKSYPVNLTAIVAMSDSGGSNKRIRDEFGLLPTSDIRQCLIALSDEQKGPGLMRQLFMYRFDKGEGISGMTFGNLFMAALADILGSQKEAIKQTGKVLRIKGHILPVSFTDTNLFAKYEDGTILQEEHLIDEPTHDGSLQISDIYLKPKADANPDALEAIKKADAIVFGPGDLFTSILPNLLVSGIPEVLKKSSAVKIFVMNLMTKYGQTYNFKASDYLRWLKKILGVYPDYVIINKGNFPSDVLKYYAKTSEEPVNDDLKSNDYYKIHREDVAGSDIYDKSKSDILVRSLIRHDSQKLAAAIMKIVNKEV